MILWLDKGANPVGKICHNSCIPSAILFLANHPAIGLFYLLTFRILISPLLFNFFCFSSSFIPLLEASFYLKIKYGWTLVYDVTLMLKKVMSYPQMEQLMELELKHFYLVLLSLIIVLIYFITVNVGVITLVNLLIFLRIFCYLQSP